MSAHNESDFPDSLARSRRTDDDDRVPELQSQKRKSEDEDNNIRTEVVEAGKF